ncbi:MAG: hypothetical protein CM15mP116_00470 [Synechococcus sp.]|nr:MAG: hypothetical protein CM15mP116_00470 [Synechococcus sp.]
MATGDSHPLLQRLQAHLSPLSFLIPKPNQGPSGHPVGPFELFLTEGGAGSIQLHPHPKGAPAVSRPKQKATRLGFPAPRFTRRSQAKQMSSGGGMGEPRSGLEHQQQAFHAEGPGPWRGAETPSQLAN